MPDKSLQRIDYLRLLDVLKGYTCTPFAAERLETLRPLSEKNEIEDRQNAIDDILDFVRQNGPFPLNGIPDIRQLLKVIAMKDSILEIKDFLAIFEFLNACKGLVSSAKKGYETKPYVKTAFLGIHPMPDILNRIRKTISPEGFVEDTASHELSRIRSDLHTLREKVKRQLEKIMEGDQVGTVLQDNYIAIRNARYVIPLKPNFNQFFQGIVHDYSHSLKTSFVEPMQVVDQNNHISMLDEEQREEEKRILRELTDWVRQSRRELDDNLRIVADFDFFQSLSLFSIRFNCVRPEFSRDGSTDIRDALNPFVVLSKKERAVPIDIVMSRDEKAVIVSGPNAGGKTVALKTAGLLLAMASSGLFIPASPIPKVPLLSGVHAIIGDEQDIETELSSFTGHMVAIKDVYEQSRGGELVLIDEIGGGTDPQEASALSMAVIDALVEKGNTVIVTTHLNLLKGYGYTRPFAVNVATDFDKKTMKPLYKLLYRVAGISNALKVAENCEMPAAIMARSYEYLGKQEAMLNDLVKGLEAEKKVATEERRKLHLVRQEASQRLRVIREKREEYVRRAEERCERKVVQLESELREIEEDVRKKERTSLRSAKEHLHLLKKRLLINEEKTAEPIRVGDHVKVTSVEKEGYVAGMDEARNVAEVVIGNMRLRANRDELIRINAKHEPKKAYVEIQVPRIDAPELNLMGMRVEEALRELDRFIDRAMVHGTSKIRIVHGIGTGRLMNAIRDHLSQIQDIKKIESDATNSGVTVVELL
jgi:DNA mismatch repair protein MutS2